MDNCRIAHVYPCNASEMFAFDYQLTDVTVGMVTHLMREKGEKAGTGSGPNVSCFSIVFDEKEYDESCEYPGDVFLIL